MSKKITIPELSLVMLVGTTGSGKSTFAKKHFKSTEVISSDTCRGLVSDDESDQTCTPEAFEVLQFIASKRLKAGKLTVIDATNVQPESRKHLIQLARRYHVLPVAIVLNVPKETCHERNQNRPDRTSGKQVIWNQYHQLHRSLKSLKKKEGVTQVYDLKSVEEIEAVEIQREPTWSNKSHEKGPFDIIGDVHGCFDELKQLLERLGYAIEKGEKYVVTHTEGRRLVFVGDLVDRGPNSPEVLRLVMDSVASGVAFCVNGNHDEKLKRKLMGREVTIAHGLEETLDQLSRETEAFRQEVLSFLKQLISHYVFDGGRLAVVHAGLKEHYLGRGSPRIRAFCMFGETTGELDEFGLPVRRPWAREYRGETLVVYGHTTIPEPEWLNNTLNIDTGCVFGGKLTAMRYPEKELVSAKAKQKYSEPLRPLDYHVQSLEQRIAS
ncbi:MAG: Bis(5'-nucleosyl)-tetraphosphatase PrpE [asymmetrical] [Chlamydiae bacterium]|nr:Bis(5'-nucleosyl)-tetraphosphatase PrpE [asymmetrical] [Chlamydiota bacterium]